MQSRARGIGLVGGRGMLQLYGGLECQAMLIMGSAEEVGGA